MLLYNIQDLQAVLEDLNYKINDKISNYELHACTELYTTIIAQLSQPLFFQQMHQDRCIITFISTKVEIIKNDVFAKKLTVEHNERILGMLFNNEINSSVEHFYYFKLSSEGRVYTYQCISKLTGTP